MSKKISVVICTYNRADFLNRTLYALQRQTYRNFEVVVVNGPSTDYTKEILKKYEKAIKILNNPYANLSISRNMGIEASAGEIIAYIDDDGIPDPDWLQNIALEYEDDTVGGVGGRVFGPGDRMIQHDGGYVDKWGAVEAIAEGAHNDPNGECFNFNMGCNSTFSKKAVLQVGGFDEYFDFLHDETDLCVRLIRNNFKILSTSDAIVHHEFAKSHIRENTYDPCRLNWYPIIKNKVYYILKNSVINTTEEERNKKIDEIRDSLLRDLEIWCKEGRITKEEKNKFIDFCKKGYAKGKEDGLHLERSTRKSWKEPEAFLPYDVSKVEKIYSICFLCKDNPLLGVGGVAKYTHELALGFARKGHIVHIVTMGEDKDDWILDWMEEGISYHRVNKKEELHLSEMEPYPTSYFNLNYSYQIYKTLERVIGNYGIDLIESPIWDYEGSVCARMYRNQLPVVVRLQTPLLKVVETQKWELTEDFKTFADFERQMLLDASGVISISNHIMETIAQMYDLDFSKMQWEKVFLGVDENKTPALSREKDKIRILTVGRLERRKGIHTIFEVIPEILSKYENVEFRFIGDYSAADAVLKDTYKNYFERKYKKEKWFDRVAFLGMVSNEEKNQEYADCDLVLAPSLYESFGLMLTEAMSSKKPTIGCRIGGMQEIIVDGETGFLIEVENKKQLSEKLKILIEDKALRQKMAEASFARYEKEFSNEVMIENTLSFYEKVMAEFKKRGKNETLSKK